MKYLIGRYVGVLCFLLTPLFSQAALVDNGTYFTDTATNTDYLKLDQVALSSYDDVVVHDWAGLLGQGWSVTSQSSLDLMSQSDRALLHTSSNQSGDIFLHTNQDFTGFASIDANWAYYDKLNSFGGLSLWHSQFNPDFGDTAYFISLSRAVPVPAAGWLFISALAGLLGRKQLFQS